MVAGDLDNNNIKPAFQQNSGNTVNYGIYAGIRNDYANCITQTLGTPNSSDQVLAAAAAGTRSFYQITAAAFGTMKTRFTTSNLPTGALYTTC